ncbi:metal dependent phosphohydrolase [Roseibium sp. TrichSKD4]|uniref:YfbR-like 5'-deoxynucleotidase n=1 Tax=Roseibium sp. TrichSKD4 TaxID=744980 RepID=UPI0001E5693C|nr:YfbR-like 5'-deoxynucleotidase [Roseibium sp. TrichSKD4]EFO32476.1 metal dependent phosphohydrolase [Roseibium sp. TrichSKD4]
MTAQPHRKPITGPFILTVSGNYFDYDNPDQSDFGIRDIAHALSNICRFGGHSLRFYSVAEHSVHVSRLVPKEDQLAALLHDAPEAFIGDMPKPLKETLSDYQRLEERIEKAVMARFGIPLPLPQSVKRADVQMLRTEQLHIMNNNDDWHFTYGEEPVDLADLGITGLGLSPDEAANLFICRYAELRLEANEYQEHSE